MFYFKDNIDLPMLPKEYTQLLLKSYFKPAQIDTHYFSGQGEFKITLIPEIQNWVRENICNDFQGVGVQSIQHGNFDPHIDGPGRFNTERYLTLLYVIETGGDPYTRFYETPASILQERTLTTRQFNEQNLTLVGESQFKKHTWNLLNNQAIHSVTGVTSTRICLCINFLTPRPQSLVDMGLI